MKSKIIVIDIQKYFIPENTKIANVSVYLKDKHI